jgi:hypothetical protein
MAKGREAVDLHQPRLQESQYSASQPFTTRGQSPKAVALQNAYMAILCDQGDGLSEEVWVIKGMET